MQTKNVFFFKFTSQCRPGHGLLLNGHNTLELDMRQYDYILRIDGTNRRLVPVSHQELYSNHHTKYNISLDVLHPV